MPVGGDTEEIYNHNEYFRPPFVTSPQLRLVVDLGQNAVPCLGAGVCLGVIRWAFGKLHSPLARNATKRRADPVSKGLRPYCTVYKNDLPLSALTLTFKITFSV